MISHRAATGKMLVVGLVLVVTLVLATMATTIYFANPGQTGTKTSESQTTSGLVTPASVKVFGLASTVWQGTHVIALTFTNMRSGANFTAPVSNGGFSVDLPNGATYHVRVQWTGNYSWQVGVEDRGELTVNMSAGSMAAQSYNVQLETPPTEVAVHGTISWSIPSAQPFKIVYTASDGESFEAAVQNRTFFTKLPIMMDYQVKVFWLYSDGTSDYLFANNQTIGGGIGVIGLDLLVK